MKIPILALALLTFAICIVAVIQTIRVQSLSRSIEALEIKLAEQSQTTSVSDTDVEPTTGLTVEQREQIQFSKRSSKKKYKITCSYCKGEGRHVLGYPGQMDPEVYGCSICRGKGYNIVTIDTLSEQLCDACRGIGSIGRKERDALKRTEIWTATICNACRGSGKTGIPTDD